MPLCLQAQAKFLPKQFFKCKKPKKVVSMVQPAAAAASEPNPEPTPGAGCSSATDKKGCGEEEGCVWCEGSFGPSSCYDEVMTIADKSCAWTVKSSALCCTVQGKGSPCKLYAASLKRVTAAADCQGRLG
jgi:hypothetical protein